MAREPGNLSDLEGSALEEWNAQRARYFGVNESEQLLSQPDSRTPEVVAVDRSAFPVRVSDCLQSLLKSYRLLDWSTPQGDIGRAELQEEYFEWRVVRNPDGKIQRVEMTTEFPEYWEVLAAHHPVKVLRLVARFAGEPSVPPGAVYGSVDPFRPGVTPDERRAGFRDTMLPNEGNAPWSPYNNGQKAICFMSQGANTLGALIQLVVYLRVGDRNAVQIQPREVPLPDVVPCEEDPDCRSVLEPLTGGFRLGLNFVSFQRDLKRLKNTLGLRGWATSTSAVRLPQTRRTCSDRAHVGHRGRLLRHAPQAGAFPGCGDLLRKARFIGDSFHIHRRFITVCFSASGENHLGRPDKGGQRDGSQREVRLQGAIQGLERLRTRCPLRE